jgi:meiotically up-regulated gene 157 (Mug157) protein
MFLTPEKRETSVDNMSNNLNSIQINTEVLRTVLETLLKNDSTNQDLQEYLIIKSSNSDLTNVLLNLISKIIEEANANNTNNNFENNKNNNNCNSTNDANKKKFWMKKKIE